MTPTAASIKDHRFVGADSQVGSLSLSVCGRVAIRRVVMRQMKKPMLKRTMRPRRFPNDILSFMIMGRGRKKMIKSIVRFDMAFVQLLLLA